MDVYGILMKYNSHYSNPNTPRVDVEATKLYSVITWDASLGTSWELLSSLTGRQDRFYTVNINRNHNILHIINNVSRRLHVHLLIKFVYICDVMNLHV